MGYDSTDIPRPAGKEIMLVIFSTVSIFFWIFSLVFVTHAEVTFGNALIAKPWVIVGKNIVTVFMYPKQPAKNMCVLPEFTTDSGIKLL